MFSVHTQALDALIEASRYTRWIFIDVEPGQEPGQHNVVLRGEDKAKAGNPKAIDTNKPALHWNDETGAHRSWVIATTDNRTSAELAQAQVIGFYSDDSGKFSDRWAALGEDARALMPVLMALFGIKIPPGRAGDDRGAASFADRADRAEAKARKDAGALLKKLAPVIQAKKSRGADTSDIEALLAKLLSA